MGATHAITTELAPPRRRLFRDTVRHLFGYDFFISYSHADGLRYPRLLAERLKALGFRVFLDKHEYVAGDDLRIATRTRIRSSRKLVVIVRPHALDSEWVQKEVSVCLEGGKEPVVVDVNETLMNAPSGSALVPQLAHRLYITESTPQADGEPSEHVVNELLRSFKATRTETLRVRVLSVALGLFALVALTAVWQAGLAREQERLAREREMDAVHLRNEYESQCKKVVAGVEQGHKTIQGLKTSPFGELVAAVAEELAKLPETSGVSCLPDPRPSS